MRIDICNLLDPEMTDYNPYAKEPSQSLEYKVLELHAYDWVSEDKATDDNGVGIRCWGLDRNSEPYLLRFDDFPAFCYIELPTEIRKRYYHWTSTSANAFMKQFCKLLKDNAPYKYNFVWKPKVYYYTEGRNYPMIQVMFKNLAAMKHCENILNKPIKTLDWGPIKCKVWESKISIVRKLLAARSLRYSQWFRVVGYKVEPELQISTCKHEYIAQWDTISPVPTEECKDWSTKPGILSFDIECYSNNHRAMPSKYDAQHVVYMISCIYQKYKEPSTRKRYGIIIGDCDEIPTERLANCKIIRTSSELGLAQAFADVINETDPEVMIGYNIMGFDYPYMDHRISRTLDKWPKMSRLYGKMSEMESINWKSGAYGHQSINIVHMEGRISIDLLPVIKREHTTLDKYDLNTVCSKFIGKTKHDIKASEMFQIYENMRDAIIKLHHLESKETPDLLNDPLFISEKAQAQDEYKNAKHHTTRVMEYCIQDSELVIELMEKTNTWIGLIEMSNIVGTTVVDLFTRGQQVRCLSQLYEIAAKEGYVLDSRDAPAYTFAGGYVKEPIPGLYDNIICLDFSSLYPSIMMAYNICYTTLVHPSLEDSVLDEDCNIIEFDQEETEEDDFDEEEEDFLVETVKRKKKVVNTVVRHYRFKFYKKVEGLLPKLERILVAERRAVRKAGYLAEAECKALENIENLSRALNTYISDGPCPKIFEYDEAKNILADLVENNAFHKEIEYGNLLLKVAELVRDSNIEELTLIANKLNAESKERNERIEICRLTAIILDKRQLAIKVSCNSFFGFLGVRNGGKMPLLEGAMSITAMGRKLIGEAREYIEEKYGGVQVYGDTDSIRGDSPLLIRRQDSTIDFVQIEDLIQVPKDNESRQEYFDLTTQNIDVWTDIGWTQIKYLMRHKTPKRMFRVLTHTGVVDASEDHSLLNELGDPVTPGDIKVGGKLLHEDLPNVFEETDIDEDKAWAWGFFMAEGTCGVYDNKWSVKSIWSVSNQNQEYLKKCQDIMRRIEPDYDFVIDPCMKSSNVDKLNVRGQNLREIATRYERLFCTKRSEYVKQRNGCDYGVRYKKVPSEILMAPNNIKQAFFDGWYAGDGSKTEKGCTRFDIVGKIGAAGLYYISACLGWKASINYENRKPNTYRLTLTKGEQRVHQDKIKKIVDLGPTDEYIYDIETENHRFAVGPGRMVVHNSVMMDLKIKDPKDCQYWGDKLAEEISGVPPGGKDVDGKLWPEGRPGLFPPPLAMEFEKAMRLLCIRKKKYAAYLINKHGEFETDDVKDKNGNVIGKVKKMLKKGIVLARRDNCKYLRDTYLTILHLIMEHSTLPLAMDYLVSRVKELFENKIKYDDLVIIKGLGANYKSESYFMAVFGAYLKRENKDVKPGDRLDFLIIKDPDAKLLGNKMRLKEQYIESLDAGTPLELDYMYYVEKILMNPINQLFSVGFGKTISEIGDKISYLPPRRRKHIYLDEPIKMMIRLMERGYDIDAVAVALNYTLLGKIPDHWRKIPVKLNIVQ